MTAVVRRRIATLATVLALLGCNDGLAPRPLCPSGFTGICGSVTFRGALPDSTDAVYLVAYAAFPRSPSDLFTFQPSSPPALRLDSAARADSQHYQLPLPPGQYAWVLAAWKKVGTLTSTNADSLLREAGYYRDPADTSRAGSVVVGGSATGGVNFVVDFTNMHPVSYYFPPQATQR
jgi:hypothetical protein